MNATAQMPSSWTMLEDDPEVGDQLRAPLRLAFGVQALPYGDGVALVGGAAPVLFSGHGLRQVMARVLPLLDGGRTVERLEEDCSEFAPGVIRDLIGNLFMSGLLRTGAAPQEQDGPAAYLDRVVGATGVFESGAAAADKLRNSRLAIHAEPAVAGLLADAYMESGGGACVQVTAGAPLDPTADLLLVVQTPGVDECAQVFAAAERAGIPALNIEVARGGARVGPYILPRISASYACFRDAHPGLAQGSGLVCADALMWACHGLHMAIAILTRTLRRPPANSFVEYRCQQGRWIDRHVTVARLYGWDDQGNPQPVGLQPGEAGYEGWKQYCGIALQVPSLHPANSYLMHFRTENILSIFERVPAIYSGLSVALPGTDEALNAACARPGISVESLALLLRHAAGFTPRDGVPRRVAPTGGNLGSSLLLCLVRDVAGIAPGIYWYDSQADRLERMPATDLDAASAALRVQDYPVAVISFANVAKVARKYGPFALNVGWYDAGVLLAYARALTDGLGLTLDDLARGEPGPGLEALGLPGSSLVPTGVMGLRAPAGSRMADGLPDLLAVMTARRAVRNWGAAEVGMATVHRLVRHADRALSRHRRLGGTDLTLSLRLVLKLSDAEDGIYEYSTDRGLVLMRGCPRHLHAGLLSQARLAEAPVIALPQVDLGAAIADAGDAAVEVAYRAAGAVVGELWLHAASLDLGGTACGGAFEGELRRLSGRHGLANFSPLALCLGPLVEAKAGREVMG